MPTSVSLPALGESVTEGTVTRWLKQVGDTVAVDEPLLEVSTDKVDTEIPSPVAGTLLEIKAAEDETVEVGAELAVIGDAGESAGSSAPAAEQPAEQAAPEPQAQPEQSAQQAPAETPAPPAEQAPAAQAPDNQASGDQGSAGASSASEAAPDQSGGGSGTPVTLPALGESVTEGTVTRWLKQVGDDVAVDEPLLEVSTDKVDTEIPSPVAGKLLEIKVAEDETVEVGAELATIGSGDAAPAAGDAAAAADGAQGGRPAEEKESEQDAESEGDGAPQAASQTAPPKATPDAAESDGQPEPKTDPQPQQEAQQSSQQKSQQTEPVPSEEPNPGQQRTSAAPQSGDTGRSDGSDGGPYVTPLVRKMAAEHGVDLADIKGSGVGG